MLDDLRRDGVEIAALTPSGSETLDSSRRAQRLALVAGHEGRGLSEAALARADRHVRIPMAPGADSLNVVTAVAIALPVRLKRTLRSPKGLRYSSLSTTIGSTRVARRAGT